MMNNTQVITTGYGMKILLQPMPGANSIACYGAFPTGARLERPDESGLYHLCEHLMFRGTSRFPSGAQLMEAFERDGVVTRALTARDIMAVGIQAEPDTFGVAFDLFLDVLWDTHISEDDFKREQTIVINELLADRDDNHISAKQALRTALWGIQHPLGSLLGGTPESVAALRYEQVVHAIQTWMCPANTTLVVTGRFDPQMIKQHIIEGAQRFSPGLVRDRVANGPLAPVSEVLQPIHAETAYLLVGFRIPAPYSRWSWPLAVLSFVLGEGNTSRLFMKVRQERQMAYDLYSQAREYCDGTEFLIYCNPATEHAWEAMRVIRDELSAVGSLRDEEVEIAKRRLKAHWSFALESAEEYAYWLSDRYMSMGEFCPLPTLLEGVSAVTPDQVRELGRTLFDWSAASRVLFAPESVLEERPSDM